MKIPQHLLIMRLLLMVAALPAVAQQGKNTGAVAPHLTLPPELYAVVGVPMHIEFRNSILPEPQEGYQFEVECGVGKREGDQRWSVHAGDKEVGVHKLHMRLKDSAGNLVHEAESTIRVVPQNSGAGEDITLLIVGDSLTAATHYANEVGRLLSEPGNPKWMMLGTARARSAKPNVAHEGYGGWTWQRFNTLYEDTRWKEINGRERRRQSPFLFVDGEGGKPMLDIGRFVQENGKGRKPDFVTFLLGINDCFSADHKDPAAIDAKIDAMFEQAELLLTAFREALPEADLGVCLTTPPNARDEAFVANYKDRYTRRGWRTIQYRLVERQLEHFKGREKEHIYLIPTSLDLDPVEGYPANNGVHPNEKGYQRIGNSIYAWLKWRMMEKN